MTATALTPAPAHRPRPLPGARAHRLAFAPLRAIRAFGGAVVSVAVLGRHDEEAGVRDPRPAHRD
ncbi:hypothetical protein [Streptomyces sp. NPDC094032]|uniref:hypothetical protein n=1 Tax=Streptomyces sp. NPDC094032 TaxID=3155308 RepID=UPI003331F6DD